MQIMKVRIDNDSLRAELKRIIGDNKVSITMPQDIFIELSEKNVRELETDSKPIIAEEIIYDIRIDWADKDILVEIALPSMKDTISNFEKVEILD